MFEPVLNACKIHTDAPELAYISFPPTDASVTVCSNQPVTNLYSYLEALLVAELVASCFFPFHFGEGKCSILDLHSAPNQKVIGVFQKEISHLSGPIMYPWILFMVSPCSLMTVLFSYNDFLTLSTFYFKPATTSASKP